MEVEMTQIDEPNLDEQIELMKAEFYASDLSPKSFDLTIGIRTKMLVATQIQEARQDIADEIGKMMEIQGANGTWNYDSYMHGMYNGMEFCHSLVKGVEPKYRNAPKQWIADIPMPTDAEPIQDIAQLRSTPNEDMDN